MVARWRGRWRKAQAASATGAGGDEVHVNVWWHRATRQRQRAQTIEWGEGEGVRCGLVWFSKGFHRRGLCVGVRRRSCGVGSGGVGWGVWVVWVG
mgnify:CR=1 FL=1